MGIQELGEAANKARGVLLPTYQFMEALAEAKELIAELEKPAKVKVL